MTKQLALQKHDGLFYGKGLAEYCKKNNTGNTKINKLIFFGIVIKLCFRSFIYTNLEKQRKNGSAFKWSTEVVT